MSGCVPGENGTEEEEGEEGRWSLGDSIWDKRGKKRKKSSQERRRSFIHSSAASEESGREKKEIKKKRREDIVPYNLKEVAESPSTLSDDRRRSVRLALIQEWIGETECGSQIVLWLWAQGLPPSEEEEEAPTGLEEGGACWREPSGSGRSSKVIR